MPTYKLELAFFDFLHPSPLGPRAASSNLKYNIKISFKIIAVTKIEWGLKYAALKCHKTGFLAAVRECWGRAGCFSYRAQESSPIRKNWVGTCLTCSAGVACWWEWGFLSLHVLFSCLRYLGGGHQPAGQNIAWYVFRRNLWSSGAWK